jgi:D-arabinose 1-dehydrogenase-like Zn-dependent alcohol dehydrogenase
MRHSSSNSKETPSDLPIHKKYHSGTDYTTMSLPKTYKRAAFVEAGQPLKVDTAPLKMPGAGEILVKVEACGVCHSDVFVQYNVWGAGFPMVPGHEIIGRVAALGEGVNGWKNGDRIGGSWHGGHDGTCDTCKQGLPQFCQPFVVNGVTKDGGCKYFPHAFPFLPCNCSRRGFLSH